MPRVNIHISAMSLKKIDLYCQEKNTSRSKLLVNCALSFISSHEGLICQNCRNPSIGKYKMTIYDWEQGENEKELHLCQFHLDKARQEGAEVKEL